jgi:plastocyanin
MVPHNWTMTHARFALLLPLLLVASCSDDIKAGDAPAGTADAPAGTADAAPGTPDAPTGAATLNGCTNPDDRTASTTLTINCPTGGDPGQYTPFCIKVRTGTTITWSGSFSNHPLTRGVAPGSTGTDSPGNPITNTSSGGSIPFTFNATGMFGFYCARHPGIMRGAITVVP